MSEGPVKFVGEDGVEVELFGAEEAGRVPSNDLSGGVTHEPFRDDVVVVTQRVGSDNVETKLYPGESVGLGGGNIIVHEIDL
jgi:hypothetical protein